MSSYIVEQNRAMRCSFVSFCFVLFVFIVILWINRVIIARLSSKDSLVY